ncbi:MAG: tetratricopeptide repeat protein [Bacteroidales bacterium]
MKKLAFLLILSVFAVEMVNAQSREVRRANRSLGRGDLEVALEHIQNALKDESTMNDPETHIVNAKIHMEIAGSEEPEFANLVEEPLIVAFEAMQKAKELDVDNQHLLDIQQTNLMLSEYFFNAGAIKYEDQQFSDASNYFMYSYKVSETFGSVDTATLYNAGLAAEIAGEADRAYDIYVQVEEMDYDQPFLYSSLANISIARENTDEAVEWIKKGREKYPDNLDMIFAEANIYLNTGNIPEARRILEIALERDPDNPNLHYAFAVNYDQMSRDTLFSEEEREFAYKESIKAYETAIELKPDYFDAIYNLGALYFNEGIGMFVEAENRLRETMDFQAYEEEEKKIKEVWLQAQPYLEEAFNMIDEDDENYEVVLRSLRELYMRTDQDEKLEETNEIWNERFGSPDDEE